MLNAPLCTFGALAVVACSAIGTAGAEDVVYLSGRDGGAARIRVAGTVVDYTGKQLILKLADGGERTYPGEQVVSIETERSADHRAADEARERGDYRGAAVLYDRAVRSEQRRWTRRMIVAELVGCYRNTQHLDSAGEWYLLLVKDDAQTPYFHQLPLAWLPAQPSPGLQSKAEQWLKSDLAVARLLAASHLLSTSRRGEALATLEKLAVGSDQRIALLAEAQRWRTAAAIATEQQLAAWEELIARLPEPLRAGPYLVIGQAWATRGNAEAAALTLLRVPILHASEPLLAAEALWSAGQVLEKTDGTTAAALYRELLRDHPNHALAAQVRSRLEALSGGSTKGG